MTGLTVFFLGEISEMRSFCPKFSPKKISEDVTGLTVFFLGEISEVWSPKFSPKKIGDSLSPKKELGLVERFALFGVLEPLGLGSRGEQTSKNW